MGKSLNDISLVARVVAFGDKRAFDALVKKYQSSVRSFFMGHTFGDAQLGDDLAQETFIKAYVNIGRFRNLSGFSTWLFRIAYRVLLDDVRARKRLDSVDADAVKIAAGGADGGMRMDIYRCMRMLRAEERTCITLQLVEGQSLEGIAEITGIPVGTVKSHLSRGKAKLALYLKENGYG